jgi:NIPSNAP
VAATREERARCKRDTASMQASIVELRQYTLHPGMRDTLVDLFDREFIEPQEALGMTLIGQFRALDDPNLFVWLRDFADMPSRRTALTAFYSSAVWKANRAAANATIVDSDNVLLLRPARPGSGFDLSGLRRPSLGEADKSDRVFAANIHYFHGPEDEAFANSFPSDVAPVVTRAGADIIATFVTDPSPNDYPALPVRQDVRVFAWFAAFPDADAYEKYRGAMSRSQIAGPAEVRLLSPTSRSLLR